MVEVRDACFAYTAGANVLDGVSLTLRPGEHVVLLGRNGSGKSTLGRLLNGGLAPSSGSVSVDGERGPRRLAQLVGYVRQDPRSQIVSPLVSDEVAFGPRNLGLPRGEVLDRVAWALGQCGIEGLSERLTAELSGGQQQLVAIAGVLAMKPRYLVLDEVGSHLDERTRDRVRDVVRSLTADGVGVAEIAHSPQDLFGADRVAVLEGGRIAWEGTPTDLFESEEVISGLGWRDDVVARTLCGAVRAGYRLGPRPDEGVLSQYMPQTDDGQAGPGRGDRAPSPLVASGVHVEYGGVCALGGVDLTAATLTLVLGASGSGKTTLAHVLAGVLAPDAGRVGLGGCPVRAGLVGLVFQRPEDQLFCDTVLDELTYGPLAAGATVQAAACAARDAAGQLGLSEELLSRSPFELSGGQMHRAALAATVAARPAAYVFDEPTAGLDAPARRQLKDLVRALVASGAPAVVITHDAQDWLADADDVYFLASGRVVAHVGASEAVRSPEVFERAGLLPPLSVRLRARAEGGRRA